jgi:thiol:disulfide interchange protein
MMIRFKRVFIFIVLWLFCSATFAQIQDPVKWTFSTEKTSDTTANLYLKAKIEKGWHLYSQNIKPGGPLPTEIKFEKSKQYQLIGKAGESKGVTEYDSAFEMKILQFSKSATFTQKIKVLSDKKFTIKGTVNYMCCSGVSCLPPKDVEFNFTLEGFTKSKAEVLPDSVSKKPEADSTEKVKKDTVASVPANADNDITGKGGSLWWIFLTGFLAGLAGVITPCVFPMIPMTVSFFLRGSEKRSKAKKQAIFYGISIIFIYTCIGLIISALLGPSFINWLSTHWLPNILFFLLFLIFALSFLGMFEIIMPSWLVNKSDKQVEKGGYIGTFFMALTLVLVSFSCTAPIVGALLVEAATGQVIEPAIGMFGFSLAFALPFTLLAFFPALLAKMPKSGGWMNSVKVVLGFFIMALGMKYLVVPDQVYHWNLLSRDIFLALWIVIFTLMGLYLLGKIKLKHDSDLPHVSILRLILSIFVFTFVIYLMTGLFGNPLKSISSLLPPQETSFFTANPGNTTTSENKFELCEKPKYSEFLHFPPDLKLQGYFDYAQGMACAKKLNKPVLLDFNGHACAKCKEMEAKVWSNEQVLKKLREDYLIISLFTDDRAALPESEWITSAFDGKIKKTIGDKNSDFQTTRFKVNAMPFYVLLDTAGEILVPPKGHDLNIENYVKFLDDGLKEFEKRNIKP